MIRRSFFVKLGALVGMTIVSTKVTLSDSMAPENTNALDPDTVYKFSKTVPSPFELSAADIEAFQNLKKSFKKSGKLLSIKSSGSEDSSKNAMEVQVVKTFNSKQSRNEYIALHKNILSQKNRA